MGMIGLRDYYEEYMSIAIRPDEVVSFGALFRFNLGSSVLDGVGFSSFYAYISVSEIYFYSTEDVVYEIVSN